MTDRNEQMAEVIEWQTRCNDLQTSNERLREERDALLNTLVQMRQREDALLSRITELEATLQRLTLEVSRHRSDGELYP